MCNGLVRGPGIRAQLALAQMEHGNQLCLRDLYDDVCLHPRAVHAAIAEHWGPTCTLLKQLMAEAWPAGVS